MHGVEAGFKDSDVFEGRDRKTGKIKWAGRVDLVFGANSELRAVADVPAYGTI